MSTFSRLSALLITTSSVACAPTPEDSGVDDTGLAVPVFDCANLSKEEQGLLSWISVAGSSNSYDAFSQWGERFGPLAPGEYTDFYPGKMLAHLWPHLQPCGAPEPRMWVYWYTWVDEQSANTTFFLALDAFFHYLDDNPELEVFRERVQAYLAIQHTLSPQAPFLVGNVPLLLMTTLSGRTNEEKLLYNEVILEEVTAWPSHRVVDLDHIMGLLIDGEIVYEGEQLEYFTLFQDLLHLNDLGHVFLAQIGLDAMNEMFPHLLIPPMVSLEIPD